MTKGKAGPDRKALRTFGLAAGGLFVALFGLLPLCRGRAVPAWPFLVAAPLWIAALLAPPLLAPVHRVFTRVGEALGWINTRIVLGLVYFLLLTPMALVMRCFRRDALRLSFDPSLKSYRVSSERLPRERMEVPY